MGKMLSALYRRTVLAHPVAVLAALAVVLSIFGFHSLDFSLDSSADTLLLENDRDLNIFREVTARYGIRDSLVVAFVPDAPVFSKNTLNAVGEMKSRLEDLDAVESVFTILDVPLLQGEAGNLSDLTSEEIRTLKSPDVNAEQARKEISESPIFSSQILSADGTTTALLINLKPSASEPEAGKDFNEKRHRDIEQIRDVLLSYRHLGALHLGGVPMIADDMITFIRKDLIVFGGCVLVFIIAVLAALFKKARWVVLPVASCLFAVITMMGILGILDWKVTVISSNFIALMLILTLSMNIHLVVRYLQVCRMMPDEPRETVVATTVKKMAWPCLYTALTTILAFSTLVFSNIKPVIDFGWMMVMGLAVTFFTSFTLFPAALMLLKKDSGVKSGNPPSKIAIALGGMARNHGGTLVVVSILFVAGCALGIPKLRVENSFINYFKKHTEIYQGMKLMDEKLGGTSPLDIILRFGDNETSAEQKSIDVKKNSNDAFGAAGFGWANNYDPKDYWFTPLKIQSIESVHDYLSSMPEVGKVLSLASIIRVTEKLNDGKPLESLDLSLLYKKLPEEIKTELVEPYIDMDHNEARLSIRIKDSLPDLRRKAFIDRIQNDLAEKFGFSGDKAQVSGVMLLYNNMLQSLFRSQILTLGTVMLGIAAMFLVLFRSPMLCLVGILPNAVAVCAILGILGWLNIPLDMMTITIAAITMGIGVDNSIHYLYRFREEFAQIGRYGQTIDVCQRTVGKAIVNTSATIVFGFAILVMSNFIPTVYFGIFTGLAMVIAMVAVLTLLPKCLMAFRPLGASPRSNHVKPKNRESYVKCEQD